MKILFVVDTMDWAIGHLAQAVDKFNPQHNIRFLVVSPRDLGNDIKVKPPEQILKHFMSEVKEFNPDVIQFEYWRLAGQLIMWIPELGRYKKIVMHHNQSGKALFPWDWQNNPEIKDKEHLKMDTVMCHLNKTRNELLEKGLAKNVEVLRYGFDHSYWTYSSEEPKEMAIGYAGRIVPWKRLKELAEVAIELDYNVQIMGKIDKQSYWDTVPKDNLKLNYWDCADEDRVEFYRNITIFVQNSTEGYEAGTMPMLEAMACGVPVITTPTGQAEPEENLFKDHQNCLLVPFDDKEALKNAIKELMTNKDLRDKLRKNGWEMVKHMTEEKRAREYSRVWNKIAYPDHVLASVITPVTYDRLDNLYEIIKAMKLQSYPNIEFIVVFDEKKEDTEEIRKMEEKIKEFGEDLTIKILYTNNDEGYNLAKARNIGIIESEGEVLIFNDSRLKPDENAVMMFVEAVKNASVITMGGNHKVWFFGDKGSQKQSFVENFSAVKRSYLIDVGMFCERMDRYGGLTQEIRTRWAKLKGEFSYLEVASAEEISGSKTTPNKRKDIVESKLKLWKMYGDERY